MPEEFDAASDEELRRSIRAEIEQRDRERSRQTQQREQVRNADASAEKRRQIYQEELRRYYAARPDYREVVREDGEVDWVSQDDLRSGEKLFDEVLEDPADARKRLKIVLIAGAAFAAFLAVFFFIVLAPRSGTIMINTNVPDARIILDTKPLDDYSNAPLEEVPAGEHVITVQKTGYVIVGEPVQRITLRGGKTVSLTFRLQPEPAGHRQNPTEPNSGSRSQKP